MDSEGSEIGYASKVAFGRAAEDFVADYLAARGMLILDRNARLGNDELDIVARRGRLLIICEVKATRSDYGYSPVETIDFRKQQRIRRAALKWIGRMQPPTWEIRFDAAAVVVHGSEMSVTYYEEAF